MASERQVQGNREATVEILATYFSLQEDEAAEIANELTSVNLRGGEPLFQQGEESDSMYLLIRGRLQVWLDAESPVFIGEVLPGESVGEVGLITKEKRSADVVAIRRSVLLKLERHDFERLAAEHPSMVMQLTQIVARRLHDNTVGAGSKKRPAPNILCIRPLDDSERLGALSDSLRGALSNHGSVLHLSPATMARDEVPFTLGPENDSLSEEFEHWISEQEAHYRFIVLECEPGKSNWSEFAEGQSDLVLLLADAKTDPSLRSFETEGRIVLRHVKHEVLILQHEGDAISGTDQWLKQRHVEYHLHLRGDRHDDLERVARIVSGNANGLVLGGGAARGFAHLGTYRALCEAGVPIDWVGGTSIGAIMGVAVCLYEQPDLVDERVRDAFVKGRPFADYTLPIVSVLSGNRMNTLSQKFMPGQIEDLAIPFFAISSDINTGEINVHEDGPVWRATGASAALPGVLPPMVFNNTLAVDGAVLNNLPVDVMSTKPVGRIYAAVLSSRDQQQLEIDEIPSVWQLLVSRFMPSRDVGIPSLASLLFKATEVANRKRTRQLAESADVLFHPPVQGFSLLKVDQFDDVVKAGYDHTKTVIAEHRSSGVI